MIQQSLTIVSSSHNQNPVPTDDPVPITETIIVFGNHGYLTCDGKSGLVLSYQPDDPDHPHYADIVRVDIDEWRQAYPDEFPTHCHIDICDIGFWADTYVPPEPDYRTYRNPSLARSMADQPTRTILCPEEEAAQDLLLD